MTTEKVIRITDDLRYRLGMTSRPLADRQHTDYILRNDPRPDWRAVEGSTKGDQARTSGRLIAKIIRENPDVQRT